MSKNSDEKNLFLKKRLIACRTANGRLSRIPDDLTVDILKSWERWPGTISSFYQGLGIKQQHIVVPKIRLVVKLHRTW